MAIVWTESDDLNADWIKASGWDLPVTIDAFIAAIGGSDKLEHFLTLPAAKAMPDELKMALHGVDGLLKHLEGKHDQSTHGRGGLHHGKEGKLLWSVDDNAQQLKSQVAKDVAARMLASGISPEKITAMPLGNKLLLGRGEFTTEQLQQTRWEGKMDSKDIITFRTADTAEFDKRVTAVSQLGYRDRIFSDKQYTFEEAQAALDEYNKSHSNETPYKLYEDAKQALCEDASSGLIAAWAMSSNDDFPDSLAIQDTAQRIFKLDKAAPWTPKDASTNPQKDALLLKHGDVYEAYLRAQYDNTQEFFKRKGITEITVYRGMQEPDHTFGLDFGDEDDDDYEPIFQGFELQSRPLSSWTTKLDTAESFASGFNTNLGTVFRQVIPTNRILGTPFTGLGCRREEELVILGGIDKTDVTPVEGGRTEFWNDYLREGQS